LANATVIAPVEPEGVTEAINVAAVEERAAGDADWLRGRRLEAWEVYEQTPLPTRKLEEWRYTDVSRLALDEVRLAEEKPNADPARALAVLEGKTASIRIVRVGASLVEITVADELRRQGVVALDLSAAATEHRELVERHLGTEAVPPAADKFAALNAALWSGGVFLYVPDGVRIGDPVRAVHWLDEAGVAVLPRTLIVAGANSHVAYIEEFVSPDLDSASLSCGVVEIFAGTGADVQYVSLQRWGRNVRDLSIRHTIAGRDANLDTLVVNLGASVARTDLAARLDGPGARSDMLGMYFADGDQHFDHNTRQDHIADNANSDLLYKGALYGQSHAVFRGVIRVHPGAQRTDAYQTNRNLLLSPEARAESLPNLEIEANDVRCSHGATVGQLDDEELFYLMSRGIPREQASRLVVLGFLGEVLDRLPLPDVVAELHEAIAAKLA